MKDEEVFFDNKRRKYDENEKKSFPPGTVYVNIEGRRTKWKNKNEKYKTTSIFYYDGHLIFQKIYSFDEKIVTNKFQYFR